MKVAAAERPEFTPPPESGLLRSVAMALLAHAVLVLALSWGLKWKREDDVVAVEAELWSNVSQAAAPKPVEAAPPPPPAPRVAPPPPPPAPAQREADIALEREREQQRLAQERARQQAEAERQKQEQAERRRQQQEEERQEQARRAAEEKQRREEQARRAAEERRKEEQARARRAQEEEAKLARIREENLRRMAGLAGATGSPGSTGTAMRSSGPSASYAGRLAAHFQRHVLYPGGVDSIVGNPVAVVQVRVSPTGEILSARLTRSSGNASWDEAAVRAIERSERIPADENGRYVTEFPVEMRPKRG